MTGLTAAVRDFVSLFERMKAPYVLMGGFAVRVYGIRATYDVDFTIAVARERLPELYRAIMESGYTVPEPYESGWVDQVAGMPVVKARLFSEEGAIDIDIFLAESAFQDQLLARRRQQQVDDMPVWLVSPEDLILLKLIASRPRDLVDIDDVMFIQGNLDENYMRGWAERLHVLTELEEALARRL